MSWLKRKEVHWPSVQSSNPKRDCTVCQFYILYLSCSHSPALPQAVRSANILRECAISSFCWWFAAAADAANANWCCASASCCCCCCRSKWYWYCRCSSSVLAALEAAVAAAAAFMLLWLSVSRGNWVAGSGVNGVVGGLSVADETGGDRLCVSRNMFRLWKLEILSWKGGKKLAHLYKCKYRHANNLQLVRYCLPDCHCRCETS